MVSENSEIFNLSALCRCCHTDGYFKSLQESYVYENEIEIYSKMLRDAISVEILPPLVEASNTICESCIQRLRDAFRFKQQVLLCEKKFEEYCKNELTTRNLCNENIKTESDSAHDCDDIYGGLDDYSSRFEYEIKCNNVLTKKEENDEVTSLYNQIKCEDSKTKIEVEVPKLEKKDETRGTDAKKKIVRKKSKTKSAKVRTPYDPSLEVHVKTESGIVYYCQACNENYTEQKSLKRHILLNHFGRYKCFYCEERFTATKMRNEHLKTHTEYAMKCEYCDKVFFIKSAFRDHQKTHTKLKVFKCDICLKEFAYKATLRVHLLGHYGTKRRCICHLCGHGFNDTANLNAHILTVHEKQRPYACELCPKTFTANKHLKLHILRHTGEKPFYCDQCPKGFYCKSSLKNHKISHLDVGSKYTCKVCRKRFSDRSVFARHLRRAHVGQRPFKCDICEKDFTCKYSMKRHVLEHSGVKNYVCEQCDAKFSQRGALKRHFDRKHGVRKEGATDKCDVCNKMVTDLKKHMLCHNNKRFSCEFCDKSYSENNVLTRHKKVVHFGIKPHICQFCDKKYVKVQSLKNHQLKVHKIVSKIETDEDFGSAVAKFSIKNKKGRIKTEGGLVEEIPNFT